MSDDKIDIILDELRAHRIESRERHDKLDIRVRGVEAWQENATGKATMLAAICTAVGGFGVWLLEQLHLDVYHK